MNKLRKNGMFVLIAVLSLALHIGILKGLAHAALGKLVHTRPPRRPIEFSLDVSAPMPPPALSTVASGSTMSKSSPRVQPTAPATQSRPIVQPTIKPDQPSTVVPAPPIFRVAMTAVATSNSNTIANVSHGTGSTANNPLGVNGASAGGEARAGEAPGDGDGITWVPTHQLDSMPVRRGVCVASYPLAARQLGIEGLVRLQVDVLPDGLVGNVVVLEGLSHGLDEAAIAAIKKCQFDPAVRAGEPVATRITYDYRFTLND